MMLASDDGDYLSHCDMLMSRHDVYVMRDAYDDICSMVGRNDAANAASSEVVAQAMQNQPNAGMIDESRSLSMFQRENTPTFKGKYDPGGTQEWLKEIERIFKGVHEEVFSRRCPGKERDGVPCAETREFVTEYAAKFVKPVKFYPHYSKETSEFSKCIEFENGSRSEIKRAIEYQQILRFAELVNSCRIYEEDIIGHLDYYKSLNEKRAEPHHDRKKPYDAPTDKGKQKVADGKKPSGEGAPAIFKCYRCGEQGAKVL
ncbi:uncharacterized protein LOC131619686 [Vicia villosa]|uniref:uncharacterized protein LOC131619686 n=1 Tax=Vicia villosa TaxID=3911 RepID=UPI00273CDF74|nr:uncharacterized protein LOC131619686 [Vicia villosa]